MLTRLFFLFFSIAFSAYIKLDNPNINVHIVPHSHWDVGWLKTIQEYYDDNVNFVISHIVENNEKNLNLRFSFSEMFEKKNF
jgi:alpha-mannosidase